LPEIAVSWFDEKRGTCSEVAVDGRIGIVGRILAPMSRFTYRIQDCRWAARRSRRRAIGNAPTATEQCPPFSTN